MKCINCGKRSKQRLCKECRDTSPYSKQELDTFLNILDLVSKGDLDKLEEVLDKGSK